VLVLPAPHLLNDPGIGQSFQARKKLANKNAKAIKQNFINNDHGKLLSFQNSDSYPKPLNHRNSV
jgi:hypothetical protein